jgi:hypothetical protein
VRVLLDIGAQRLTARHAANHGLRNHHSNSANAESDTRDVEHGLEAMRTRPRRVP